MRRVWIYFNGYTHTYYEITVCSAKTCELCHGAGVIEAPMTNADRIRAMSDEEMVVFLDGFSGRCLDCAEDAKNKSCPIYKEGNYCRPKDIMEWLQQPAEDIANG